MTTPDGDVPLAFKRLHYLVERSQRSSVAFDTDFIRSGRLGDLLGGRGGRGGDTRLRLYMTMSLLAGSTNEKKHQISRTPASSWAEALALKDPMGAGSRSITASMNWLEDQKYLKLGRSQGEPHLVTLLDPLGSGKLYNRPNAGKGRRWARVPSDLWKNGWIIGLSGKSLATLMVILDNLGTTRATCWIDPDDRDRTEISRSSWTRALVELKASGLVEVKRVPLGAASDFDWSRFRNQYRFDQVRLQDQPPALASIIAPGN